MQNNKSITPLRKILFLIKMAVAVTLLYLMVEYAAIDLRKLPNLISSPFPLLLSVVLMVIALCANAVRWWILLGAMKENLPLRSGIRMLFISAFSSIFLPGSSSGDAIRMILSIRYGVKASRATISVLLDRIFGVVLGAVTFICFSAVYWDNVQSNSILLSIAAIVAFLLFCVLIVAILSYGWGHVLAGKIRGDSTGLFRGYIAGVLDGLQEVVRCPATLSFSILWSIVIQFLMIVVSLILASVLGFMDLSFGQIAMAFNGGLLSSVIPVTPGGLGIGEAAFDQMCKMLTGVSMAYASIFFAFRIIKMIVSLPGGIYILSDHKHN